MEKTKDDSKALRLITILQSLSRSRDKTAQDILALLQQRGFNVSKRTIERDLEDLAESQAFGAQLLCKDQARPYGWRLSQQSDLFLPALDTDLAATWDLVGH